MSISIEQALRRLAEDYGLNASIVGFMDCGFVARLGDTLNGVLAERAFALEALGEVGEWLLAEAQKPRPRACARLDQRALDQVIESLGITVQHSAI